MTLDSSNTPGLIEDSKLYAPCSPNYLLTYKRPYESPRKSAGQASIGSTLIAGREPVQPAVSDNYIPRCLQAAFPTMNPTRPCDLSFTFAHSTVILCLVSHPMGFVLGPPFRRHCAFHYVCATWSVPMCFEHDGLSDTPRPVQPLRLTMPPYGLRISLRGLSLL